MSVVSHSPSFLLQTVPNILPLEITVLIQIIFTTKKKSYEFKIMSVLLNYTLKYVRCVLKIILKKCKLHGDYSCFLLGD